jgi:hypothetical protein
MPEVVVYERPICRGSNPSGGLLLTYINAFGGNFLEAVFS